MYTDDVPNIGLLEIVIVLVILVLIFGVSRIPELGRAVGSGISELRKGVSGGESASSDNRESDPSGDGGSLPGSDGDR